MESQSEGQPAAESGADPEACAVESVTAAELSPDEAGTQAAAAEPETGAEQDEAPVESAVDGEHTCSECGMSFQRRYSLIMHTLKHEKARGYKCSVSMSAGQRVAINCRVHYVVKVLSPWCPCAPAAVQQGVPVRRLAPRPPGPTQAAEQPASPRLQTLSRAELRGQGGQRLG